MKSFLLRLTPFVLLLGLIACDPIGLGPNQDSEVRFDMTDQDGNAYFADNLSFELRQFSSSNPSSSLQAPPILSGDSSWVIRVVNVDTRMIEELDSLNDLGFNFQFYQKETNDLLELDPICSCLNYPDATSFMERFFANTTDFSDNQRIFVSYRKTFAIYNIEPWQEAESTFEITAARREEDKIYLKGNFDFSFGSSTGSDFFRLENGSFKFDIAY
ncbi:MAG: hypothetical protein AAFN10_10330 [Bacteroidota bacterium]